MYLLENQSVDSDLDIDIFVVFSSMLLLNQFIGFILCNSRDIGKVHTSPKILQHGIFGTA